MFHPDATHWLETIMLITMQAILTVAICNIEHLTKVGMGCVGFVTVDPRSNLPSPRRQHPAPRRPLTKAESG